VCISSVFASQCRLVHADAVALKAFVALATSMTCDFRIGAARKLAAAVRWALPRETHEAHYAAEDRGSWSRSEFLRQAGHLIYDISL